MVEGFANRNILCGEWRGRGTLPFFGKQNEQFRFAPNSSWPGLSRPPMLTVFGGGHGWPAQGRPRRQSGNRNIPSSFRRMGALASVIGQEGGGCAIPRKQPHQMSWPWRGRTRLCSPVQLLRTRSRVLRRGRGVRDSVKTKIKMVRSGRKVVRDVEPE